MTDAAEVTVFIGGSPRIRRIGAERPWTWLASGWSDLRRAAPVSLAWGFAFAIVGLALLWVMHDNGWYNFMFPAIAGFMLLAPILVVGLYKISDELEEGNSVSFSTPFKAWQGNIGQVALMGFVLGLFFLAWIRFATLLFALFFGDSIPTSVGTGPPSLRGFVEQYILSAENIPFLIVGTGIGAVFAFAVFSIAVVSVPMLMDRHTNIFAAIATSFRAVQVNFWPMLLWAVLISLFTAAGMAVFMVGLTIALPLIAHATWHAYRDLVVYRDEPDAPKEN
jgi:uncharacterized membrane protein